ncbi:TorD/DmsD family molecular chaperone [Aeromonas enteropelogenes]|uniref:TorD/DmsD family molecular chaperone n=1 Tax=Aeromonas enteropelogenes TaxID=29489 RepID=UPI0038CF8CC4
MLTNNAIYSRLLGALLYHPPSSQTVVTILDGFAEQEDELLQRLSRLAGATMPDELAADFFNLLQGSGTMPSPPWGSVYLDPENVLFGCSTLEYRTFLSHLGITCDTGMREPEDHIGLMLMMFSVLLDRGDIANANTLLAAHLMPFAPTMLGKMKENANTDFYQAVAAFTLSWLNLYCAEHAINIVPRPCC